MQGIWKSSAATVLIGTLLAAGEVRANPNGVPIPESPPLSCTTSAFTITAITEAGGVFPKPAPSCDSNGGQQPCCPSDAPVCSDYGYMISGTLNVDHVVFSVRATEGLAATFPSAFVGSPGNGDSSTGFLAYADHEYTVRFDSNNTKSEEAHILMRGQSSPRNGTVLVRSGRSRTESCLIATPGASGDPFQPAFMTQTVRVAGGKCTAILTFANGVLSDVTSPDCPTGSPQGGVLMVNGVPLQNNTGPHGITFGNGTTTCYGPNVPSIPKCICTAQPCP